LTFTDTDYAFRYSNFVATGSVLLNYTLCKNIWCCTKCWFWEKVLVSKISLGLKKSCVHHWYFLKIPGNSRRKFGKITVNNTCALNLVHHT